LTSKPKLTRQLPDAGMALLSRFSEPVRELILALRSRVLRIVPRAHEVVTDVGYTVSFRYGPDDRMKTTFIYVTGFTRHANLGFLNGVSLQDPAGVFEGDGAAMRHVKFESVGQIRQATWLDGYLGAALAGAGLGLNMGDAQTEVRARTGKGQAAHRLRSASSLT
jgi:hypothetical protein